MIHFVGTDEGRDQRVHAGNRSYNQSPTPGGVHFFSSPLHSALPDPHVHTCGTQWPTVGLLGAAQSKHILLPLAPETCRLDRILQSAAVVLLAALCLFFCMKCHICTCHG